MRDSRNNISHLWSQDDDHEGRYYGRVHTCLLSLPLRFSCTFIGPMNEIVHKVKDQAETTQQMHTYERQLLIH